MIDEAHERSLYTDLLLGVLKKSVDRSLGVSDTNCSDRIRRVRPSLRIIISSATIDAESFVNYFNIQPPSSSSASSGITLADEAPPTKKSRWDKKEKVEKSDAIMVRLEGRVYPVEICYLEKPAESLVDCAVETIFNIHLKVGWATIRDLEY